jgi:hypothetical protein
MTSSFVSADSSRTATRPKPSRVNLDNKKAYLDLLILKLTVEELGKSPLAQ